jgi:hypothetical protein
VFHKNTFFWNRLRVCLVNTDVSEDCIASIFRVEIINVLESAIADAYGTACQ